MLESHKNIISELQEFKKQSKKSETHKIHYNNFFIKIHKSYFNNIIKKCTYKYISHELYEDFLQVAHIGLLKAINDIDKLKTNNFYNFAIGYIRNEIYTYENTNEVYSSVNIKDFYAYLFSINEQRDQLKECMMIEELRMLDTFLTKLPELQRDVFKLYLNEVPVYKIASQLKLAKVTVNEKIKEIEIAFGEYCLNDFDITMAGNFRNLTSIQSKIITLFFKGKNFNQISRQLKIPVLELTKEYCLALISLFGMAER